MERPALLIRSAQAEVVHSDAAKREIVAVVATDTLDARKVVVDPRGLDLRAFERNSVVLWDHGKDPTRGAIPIGKSLKTWIDEDGGVTRLMALVKFCRDTYSMSIFDMHAEGKLSQWDIQVLPEHSATSAPTERELRVRPGLKGCKLLCRAGELASISAVPYSSGRGTETVSVERSLREQIQDEYRAMTDSLVASIKEVLDQEDAEFRQLGRQWLKTGGCRNVRCF